MKRLQFRKEDIKEFVKTKFAALKEYWSTRKERKEAWLEKKRNSAFAKKNGTDLSVDEPFFSPFAIFMGVCYQPCHRVYFKT